MITVLGTLVLRRGTCPDTPSIAPRSHVERLDDTRPAATSACAAPMPPSASKILRGLYRYGQRETVNDSAARRLRTPVADRSKETARQRESAHPEARRARGRTSAHADGEDRQALRV